MERPTQALEVLANAEVDNDKLRSKLSELRAAYDLLHETAELRIVELDATIARAKPLVGHWRAYAEGYGVNEPRGQAFLDCAAEFEVALREG